LIVPWLTRDGKLILAARGVRTFGYGFLSVILAIYLQQVGFDPILIGIVLTSILISGALFTVIGSLFADTIGRKKFLISYAILMAASGIIYANTTNTLILVIGALIGTLSPTGGEVGPFLSIEQAILPQSCPYKKRNSVLHITVLSDNCPRRLVLYSVPSLLCWYRISDSIWIIHIVSCL
jgi:MFS family permease